MVARCDDPASGRQHHRRLLAQHALQRFALQPAIVLLAVQRENLPRATSRLLLQSVDRVPRMAREAAARAAGRSSSCSRRAARAAQRLVVGQRRGSPGEKCRRRQFERGRKVGEPANGRFARPDSICVRTSASTSSSPTRSSGSASSTPRCAPSSSPASRTASSAPAPTSTCCAARRTRSR